MPIQMDMRWHFITGAICSLAISDVNIFSRVFIDHLWSSLENVFKFFAIFALGYCFCTLPVLEFSVCNFGY